MPKKVTLGLVLLFFILITSEIALTQNASGTTAPPSKLKIYVGPTNIPADNRAYECLAIQLLDSKSNPARAEQDVQISLSSSLTEIGDLSNPTITIPKGSTYATAQFQTTFTPGTTKITATATSFGTVQASVTTVGSSPSQLVVYGYPSTLPADGKTYQGAVIVQLQDSSGTPAFAPSEGLTIDLTSSNTAIGMVDPFLTIEGGRTYATTSFTTTMQTGTVTITPVAVGYTSKQATFTTQVAAQGPSSLKLYLGPPKVFADRTYSQQIAVALQGGSGIAKATSDITVTLASSEPDVGTVDQTVTIPAGESYALAYFDTTYKAGTTTITATASDLKTATISLTTIGSTPTKLAIFAVPPTLPADAKSYSILHVQLQDESGKPAKDPEGDVAVNLFSSTPDGGDVLSQQITIPFGETSVQGGFASTYTANSTTITAQASNYATGQVKVTTYLIDQFSLKVAVDSNATNVMPGKNATITAYVTYEGAQSASGFKITFNSTKGGNFTAPRYEGDGIYTTIFTAPKSSATIVCNVTANATKTGYTSGLGTKTITVSKLGDFDPANTGTLLVFAGQESNPLSDAIVTSTSIPSGALPLNGVTNSSGYIAFTYVPAGSYGLQITKDGYENQTEFVTVKAGQTASASIVLSPAPNALPLIVAVIVVVVVVVGVLGFIFIRKRRRSQALVQEDTLSLDYNKR